MLMRIKAVDIAISESDLREISGILETLDTAPLHPDANRRTRPRVPCRIAAAVTLIGVTTRPSIHMVTRNVSTSGFGFISSRSFSPDEMFVVYLPPNAGVRKVILCGAKFCRYLQKGRYEIGAEFIEAVAMDGDSDRIPAVWIERAIEEKCDRRPAMKA
jgi:hypothetical protein